MGTQFISKTGVTEKREESLSEFSARLKAEKEAKRRGETIERIRGETVSIKVSEAPIVARDSSGKGYTATDLLIEQNKSLLQTQPKGSYKVTKADGTVVYRKSGVSASGRYVSDVYQRIQEKKAVEKVTGKYKSIPKSAKKVITKDGTEVFRTSRTLRGQTFITTYKPGGVKETKILSKTFIGGETQLIPKQVDKKFFSLPSTPAIDFTLKQKAEPGPTPGESLARYSERLVAREKRLTALKSKVFEKLHITGKKNAKFYNIFEIAKGVARVPFEIASIPSVIGGRVVFSARALFDPAGRKELKAGLTKTPGAVREVFIHKDPITGGYQFTAQNVVNLGLVAYSTKSIAKSQSNVGLKVYEKYAKTNIKGTIRGYQGTTIFKSAGKLKGRPYQELTVFKGKASTTTIKTQGKTFIIKRLATGKGTFKILKETTKLKVVRKAGIFPKKIRLEKQFVTLKKGTFKAEGKPISFKTEKGITTQDITLLRERGASVQYIKYLEKLKTQATAKGTFGKGLKFDAKAKIKVKADIHGVVTPKKIDISKLDYTSRQLTLTKQLKKPDIKFAEKPITPKDILISKYVKEGKTITGYEKGYITQPRHVLGGPKDAFIKGEFTIKGGKTFKPLSIFKSKPKTDFYIIDKKGFSLTTEKFTSLKSASKEIIKQDWGELGAKIKKDNVIYSAYRSKKVPLKEQVALTEQIRAETYQVPFQTKAPKLQFQAVNFDIIKAPLGKGKSLPLFPVSQAIGEKKISLKPNLIDIKPPKPTPTFKVKTFQEVQPTTIFKVTSLIDQIGDQKPFTDVKVGQRARVSDVQKPKSIIEQVQTQTPVSTQIQAQKQITKQKQIFSNVFKQTPLQATFQAPQLQQFSIPKITGFLKPSLGVPKTLKGFDVFTRTKGAFKKINIRPLSKQDAINFGAFRVQTTARATFKIAEAPGIAQDVFSKKVSLEDFYKKDDLFIEKKERRIKSIGELQEITFKGIQSRKTKNIFGGKL